MYIWADVCWKCVCNGYVCMYVLLYLCVGDVCWVYSDCVADYIMCWICIYMFGIYVYIFGIYIHICVFGRYMCLASKCLNCA